MYPPASTGYDARCDQVLVRATYRRRPSVCNRTGYLTYAIADLWLGQNVADANNKLAALKHQPDRRHAQEPATHDRPVAQQPRCSGYSIRPYVLYNSTSSFFPGLLTTAAENNLVAQMWAYARPYSKVSEAPDTWSIFDSENHDAQAESFYFLAAQIFKHRADYQNRKYADGSTVAQQYKAWHDHWSNYFDERAKRGLFVEAGAPTYHGYTLDAILNIYNFADDPVLRQKAGMVLDLDFADYAQQELNDIWGGAKSRSYPAELVRRRRRRHDADSATLLFGPTPTLRRRQPRADARDERLLPAAGRRTRWSTDRAGMGSYAYVTRRPGVGPERSSTTNARLARSRPRQQRPRPTRTARRSYIMGTAELKPGDRTHRAEQPEPLAGHHLQHAPGDRVYPQAGAAELQPDATTRSSRCRTRTC